MQDPIMNNLQSQLGVLGIVFVMFFWLLRKVMHDASEREAKLMAFNERVSEALGEQTKIIDRLSDTLDMQGERLQELADIIERMRESLTSLHDRVDRISEKIRVA